MLNYHDIELDVKKGFISKYYEEIKQKSSLIKKIYNSYLYNKQQLENEKKIRKR